MEQICNPEHCTACGACAGICPKGCITFLQRDDKSGHLYPVIDLSECIDCGLCERTCPANNMPCLNTPEKTIAAFAKDDIICNTSSSGGLAYIIGSEVIAQGGVVYGSVINYGPDFCISHVRIDDMSDLSRTQGSKYVQSYISRELLNSLKDDVSSGKTVLFTGTGCQIAGVRRFLKKDYPNFFAIDIICHGVPPQKLLKEYLNGKTNVEGIAKLKFRRVSGYDMEIETIDGLRNMILPLKSNWYMMGFLKGLYTRDACHTCKYATGKRGGDLTLGDFWGLRKPVTDKPRKSHGTSVVLINTDKGIHLLDSVKNRIAMAERPITEAMAGNPQLRHPSQGHYARNIFLRLYPRIGFVSAARICLVREKLFYAYVLPLISRLKK